MNKQQLEIKRHSLAHVLATAVLEMFPEAKFGVGPNIENGFYYDFDLPRTLIPEDLPILEKKMKEVIKKNFPFEKQVVKHSKAVELYKKAGQNYKVEILKDEAKEKEVSLYRTAEFVDLCKGPHLDSTGEIDFRSFKLTKIAGAYWRGDEKNKMLQRIYGIAFENKKELAEYQAKIKEAEKRDHRKLGKELDLFMIDPLVGQGLILWQPKGALLWRIMEDFWYEEHLKAGYELVRTPHIGNRKLWETSGHWGFYNDSMYPPLEVGQSLEDAQKGKKAVVKEEYLLKPMNCPFHVVMYNSKPRSYRELPIRWAESATVYRYEKSGELSGLTRARGFTQDDAHIICTKEQAEDELKKVLDFIIFVFKSFGFNDYKVYLSVRDSKIKKYAGSDEGWDFTEKVLEKVAKEKNLDIEKDIGGAVFYGPKLDFKIKDCLGREWQCSTLQYDFNLPEKFDMNYINKKGEKERPFMLHRALFGSFERFIGVLIEHFAGAFPVWLSPIQVKILPVSSEKHIDYAQKINSLLLENDIRSEIDDSNESIGKKIREAEKQKIPYMLVVGDKEIESYSVAVRSRGSRDIKTVEVEKFIERIKKEIDEKK
ncbi:threonine--tRNA ligase [Candidatus Parcubacteria bacterium]|nr:threonine--tRNA ligase [Candidatus Parcubacteria bacterium]